MADLIADASLGGIFSGLLQRTLNSIKKDDGSHKTTLEDLILLFEEIERFNMKLDQPIKDVDRLVGEGEEIARRHSKVPWWKYFSSHRSNRTKDLNEALLKLNEALVILGIQDLGKRDVIRTTQSLQRPGIDVQDSVQKNKGIRMVGLFQPPVAPNFTVGLDEPLLKLKIELLKHGAAVLVLTGLGGSGKTTLAIKLCWDNEVRDKFRGNIFFISFSSTTTLKIIVETLFECSGYNPPELQSEEDASNQLSLLLRQIGQNPVMFVFDNIWPGQESLVEPFRIQMLDCKILLTTRFAYPRFGTAYRLQPLSDEDAMTLFCHSTFQNDSSSYIPDRLVQKVVRSCKGIPLALKVIGYSLSRQPMEVWQHFVMTLSKGHSILDCDANLLTSLEASLDHVEAEPLLKECFMDLGSFPEGQRIPVDVLIDMWIELYNLDYDGISAMAYIHKLVQMNLANISADTRPIANDNDNYYNNHFLTQHDLLRDLAIHQSSKQPFEQRKRLFTEIRENSQPEWLMEQKRLNARILSVSTDEALFPGPCDILPAETEVLVLNLYNDKYTLPKFTKKMSKLKVLIVANYGFHLSKLNKFELLGSLINLKRIRLDRLFVPSLCKLRNLRKLSLFMCDTSQAFGSSIIPISTALPNLQDLNIDYCQDMVKLPSAICDITSLKKVSITNCHRFCALPVEIVNLQNLEVLRLRNCTDLEGIPSSIGSLHRLSFLDISNCISLRYLPEEIGELDNLRELSMTGCLRCSELPFSFANLKNLKGVMCDEETAALWEEFMIPGLEIEVNRVSYSLDWLYK